VIPPCLAISDTTSSASQDPASRADESEALGLIFVDACAADGTINGGETVGEFLKGLAAI